jgi:alkylated DNA repair protein (DNA oxidative demethylase)
MTLDLFTEDELPVPEREQIGERAFVLRGFAKSYVSELMPALAAIGQAAPFRHLITPGGFRMSVGLTNCGALGWTSDLDGYRYSRIDPDSGRPWPAMPEVFMRLAGQAAAAAGFDDFMPDACLINRYEIGTRLSLHQDKNERDYAAPIVSVSLGIPAVFLFGGNARADKAARIPLHHGDVVIWGGPDRLRYHGILPLKAASHPVVGDHRINFTFRKAG